MESKYLNLLEKAVGDGLHGRAVRPLPEHGRRHTFKGKVIDVVARMFRKTGFVLALPRESGWPDMGHTMLSVAALRNFRECIEACDREGVKGDIVECGCWRGGACIYSRGVCDHYGNKREVYGVDSFDGLPRPRTNDPSGDKHHTFSILKAEYPNGLETLYGVSRVNWRKGFFEDSLPKLHVEFKQLGRSIAVLRLDGDMYSSTMTSMTWMYPLVSPGGFIIVDDWQHVPDSRRAVCDYLKREPVVTAASDYGSVMFRKI